MNKLLTWMAALLLVVSVGCSKNEDPIETVLSLSVDTVYCAWNVGEEAMEVDLSCSAPWIATTDQEWVVMEPMSGSGDKRLSVNVTEANEGKMARSAKITFKAGGKETILVVTQLPAGKLAYKITVPDWSESFIYNVMLEGKKIAELCREATEGEANADGSALKKTPETIVTLYLMREDAYPEEGIVLTNGGTFKHDGTKYTPGSQEVAEEVYLNESGKIVFSVDEDTFVEPLELVADVLTDGEGNTYKLTKIGKQYWTAENYRCKSYADELGMPITNITDDDQWNASLEGAWRYYEDDEKNGETFGLLYNAYALRNGRGFAPEGWAGPLQSEMEEMVNYLGGYWRDGYTCLFVAKFLTTNENDTWNYTYPGPQPEYLNTTGFSALNGGAYSDYSGFGNHWCKYWMEFDDIDYSENWDWGIDAMPNMYLDIYPSDSSLNMRVGYKQEGCYVRFVRK